MGHSKADKAQTHDRIVRVAAARFRTSGTDSVGLADLMQEAGLTHGGFYRHFRSRDELVAEAVERALHDGGQGVVDAIANNRQSKEFILAALIDFYLSTAHRDDLAASCAVTTLAADVSRSSARARSAYTNQVALYLSLFTDLIEGPDTATRRDLAISAWTTMVGAVSMARAVNDESLSKEILKTAGTRLKAQIISPG